MVQMSDFCRGLRGPENDGKHGTFECADAGNTGKDGSVQTVYMSDFCRGLGAPPIDGGERCQGRCS